MRIPHLQPPPAWLLAALLLVAPLTAAAQTSVADSLRLARLEAQNDSLLARMDALAAQLQARPPAEASDGGSDAPVSLEEAGETIQNLGLRVFWAVVTLITALFLIRGFVYILEGLAGRSAERRLFYKKLIPILRIVVWSLTIYIILRGIFALDAAGLAAAAAAAGVAVGFASQDILKNIFGGLVIIFDQPFQVGDKISVGGTYGEVVGIGLRSTRVVTPDDNLVSVPNAQVVDGQVSNANAGALDCQVVTDLYLPGWVDEVQAKKIAYDAAASAKYVFLEKPIVVLVKDEFKETFLTRVRVKAYVLDTRYENLLASEITERARAEFRKQGLLTPLHGARAYLDLTALPAQLAGAEEPENRGTGDAEK